MGSDSQPLSPFTAHWCLSAFHCYAEVADESLERKYQLKSQGYDIDKLADRVAEIFAIKPEEIFQPGKQPVKVNARSLFCYWAVRELGLTMADLAPKLNISQPAVSMRDL